MICFAFFYCMRPGEYTGTTTDDQAFSLDDFRWLATDLVSQPTRIAELIPDRDPATIGACDAAALGMGGVNSVPTDTKETPLLWRQRFQDWI